MTGLKQPLTARGGGGAVKRSGLLGAGARREADRRTLEAGRSHQPVRPPGLSTWIVVYNKGPADTSL